ncbi:hypothetical protein [Actinoplanes rectilineatus]|uniref:hypothetical protein n=1 Tax=Actinoplanes rectilineatus TaxID=113571 RepID=UPI0012FC3115|nr:hypothetical protein [Actinoplanes rectilineatus]
MLAVLLLSSIGTAGVLFVRLNELSEAAPVRPAMPPPPPPRPEPTSSGPQASDRPVRSADDLERVCDRWYYPESPKYHGSAPHPIVISSRDRLDLDHRTARTLNLAAYSGGAADRAAWAPQPANVQLVACLDFTGGGDELRKCDIDDPEPETLSLKEGRYRLAVYEVATRRKVAEVKLTGDDKGCPWVVVTGSDRTLYSTVADRQLYAALRGRVEGL